MLKNHNQVLDVLNERVAQDKKWGEQNHEPEQWFPIFNEEWGEFAKECLNRRFTKKDLTNLRVELVQCTAVLLAMLECCDRNNWTNGNR